MNEPATERLYWVSPSLAEFEARVLATAPHQDGCEVILDQTAFYPESGGQRHDIGHLATGEVIHVEERGSLIVHRINGPVPVVGETVRGTVDLTTRLDHSTQHTAQHLISAIALAEYDAQTVGFHMGSTSSTVDLEFANIEEIELEDLEWRANQVALENRGINVRYVNDLKGIRARGLEGATGPFRIVEIEGLDSSACCGTHVESTCQIGLIKILRTERIRRATRIEFLAGKRTLLGFRRQLALVDELSQLTGAGAFDLPTWTKATLEETKTLRYKIKILGRELARSEASHLVASSRNLGTSRVAKAVFAERDPKLVREIAAAITAEPSMIALLGTVWEGQARLVFARSADRKQDMARLIKVALGVLGGRGGGRPEMAESGGGDPAAISAALEAAHHLLDEEDLANH